MSINQPFFPTYGAGQTLAASTSSQTATIRRGNKQLRVVNLGTDIVYIHVAALANTRAATSADFIIPGASTGAAIIPHIISIPETADTLTYIAAAGTPSIHVQPGEGF